MKSPFPVQHVCGASKDSEKQAQASQNSVVLPWVVAYTPKPSGPEARDASKLALPEFVTWWMVGVVPTSLGWACGA